MNRYSGHPSVAPWWLGLQLGFGGPSDDALFIIYLSYRLISKACSRIHVHVFPMLTSWVAREISTSFVQQQTALYSRWPSLLHVLRRFPSSVAIPPSQCNIHQEKLWSQRRLGWLGSKCLRDIARATFPVIFLLTDELLLLMNSFVIGLRYDLFAYKRECMQNECSVH